ncbi:MAG: hypothetical protein JWO62_1175 [Acidimicrobiaceae bacterium]|nr:hypothetical protein [Acidimicrobiaceae bacterium]
MPGAAVHSLTEVGDEGSERRLLLTVEEAAQRLAIGRSLMYELLASGRITSIRVGRLRRVPCHALSDYVAGQLR